jgi:hypothetical protein
MYALMDEVASSSDEKLVAGNATLIDEGLEDSVESTECLARHADGFGRDGSRRTQIEGGRLSGTGAEYVCRDQ